MSYPGLLDDCKDHILLCTHLEDSKLKLKTHYWANYARLILVPITAQSSTSSISVHLPQSQLHLYHKALSSPTAIIDSGITFHIHPTCNDFLSLDTSTSHNIKGFGGAKSHVTGHGTALIAVHLPSGHQTCIKLGKAC